MLDECGIFGIPDHVDNINGGLRALTHDFARLVQTPAQLSNRCISCDPQSGVRLVIVPTFLSRCDLGRDLVDVGAHPKTSHNTTAQNRIDGMDA